MKMCHDQREWSKKIQRLGFKFQVFKVPEGRWITKRLCFDGNWENYRFAAQPIPDIPNWQEYCRELQSKGVIFETGLHGDKWRSGESKLWAFQADATRYSIPEQPIPEWKEDYSIPEQPIPEWKEEPMATELSYRAEHDPNGLAQNEPGAKLDAGKIQAALVLGGFAKALEEVSKVGTFGAKKYSPNGWKSVEDGANRYSDAMMRHWLAHQSGELIDTDSGLSHLSQVAWNALAVLQLTVGVERVE